MNGGELVADEVWQIINDSKHSLQEREVDLEQSGIERRENTNLRILKWMHNIETDEGERKTSSKSTYQQ